ncbi:MAG: hypothetical protein Q9195_008816 [Heterodermia aff. obscurata]
MTSRAHAILEAVKLSIDGEGGQMLRLVSEQSTLKPELILRIILTYLPESLDIHSYQALLAYLSGDITDRTITTSPAEPWPFHDQLSDIDARERVKRLHLLPLFPSHLRRSGVDITDVDPFTQFIIHRAHRIELETGSLPLVAQLVEPFLHHSDYLRTWAISGLLPLLRLDYEYYANKEPTYSLEAFGDLSGHEVVESLLSKAVEEKNKDSGKHIARDLRGLVGPWMYGQKSSKRRKLEAVRRRRSSAASTTSARDGDTTSQDQNAESWAIVNDWLLDLSMRSFIQVADAIAHWDGPQDVNYGRWKNESAEMELNSSQNPTSRYAQTGLAMIYANDMASMSVIESSHGVLQRAAELMKLINLPELPTITDTLAQSIPEEAHRDPMLLVGKILDQNPRSYTKLDDLLDIGQNLVAASLTTGTVETDHAEDDRQEPAPPSLVARRRIISMAIEAALKEDDFDTAYSYVVNRLQPDSNPLPNELSAYGDDASWRAAFKAGCYLVPKTSSGSSTLRRLEQRMELLSQALLLAPTTALSDILDVWRQCEEDLNSALTQEAEAEEKWDARADQRVPGQFSGYSSPVTQQKSRDPSRAAMNEEAPMGLFDVARGAAATLSKNASLLGSSRNDRSSGQGNEGHEDAEGRVRKRDIVSNMVTGGLASGIGWVLGAPPPVRET